MEIKFAKKYDKHVISCNRKDGSSTWMQSDDFYIYHDLLHYAVETIMPFKNAFFGMLASGISITDFELPKEQRNIIFSEEALVAESIVNLIAMERTIGPVENFNVSLAEAHAMMKHTLSIPSVTDVQLTEIKNKYSKLINEWQALPINSSLVLNFEE